MNLRIDVPQGWSRRVDRQRVRNLLTRYISEPDLQLPADPGGGAELYQASVDDGVVKQLLALYGEAAVQMLMRRIVAASLTPEKAGRTSPEFELSESTRETLGIIAALAIPIILLGLLIWLLGRDAKT